MIKEAIHKSVTDKNKVKHTIRISTEGILAICGGGFSLQQAVKEALKEVEKLRKDLDDIEAFINTNFEK